MASQAVFAGMPDEGLAFLEDLEERNTKEFFDANKQVFREQVQAPFAALLDAAAGRLRRTAPGLGQPKVFRIYRDLRFSKDKTPYKTSMRAWVAHPSPGGVESGYYVDVGPSGMYAGGGRYHWARPELERLRAAVADPDAGQELARILRRAAAGPLPHPRPPARARPVAAHGRAAGPPGRGLAGPGPPEPLARAPPRALTFRPGGERRTRPARPGRGRGS